MFGKFFLYFFSSLLSNYLLVLWDNKHAIPDASSLFYYTAKDFSLLVIKVAMAKLILNYDWSPSVFGIGLGQNTLDPYTVKSLPQLRFWTLH